MPLNYHLSVYSKGETEGCELRMAYFWRDDPRQLADKEIFKEEMRKGYKVKNGVVISYKLGDIKCDEKLGAKKCGDKTEAKICDEKIGDITCNDKLRDVKCAEKQDQEHCETNFSCEQENKLNDSFNESNVGDWIVVDEVEDNASDVENTGVRNVSLGVSAAMIAIKQEYAEEEGHAENDPSACPANYANISDQTSVKGVEESLRNNREESKCSETDKSSETQSSAFDIHETQPSVVEITNEPQPIASEMKSENRPSVSDIVSEIQPSATDITSEVSTPLSGMENAEDKVTVDNCEETSVILDKTENEDRMTKKIHLEEEKLISDSKEENQCSKPFVCDERTQKDADFTEISRVEDNSVGDGNEEGLNNEKDLCDQQHISNIDEEKDYFLNGVKCQEIVSDSDRELQTDSMKNKSDTLLEGNEEKCDDTNNDNRGDEQNKTINVTVQHEKEETVIENCRASSNDSHEQLNFEQEKKDHDNGLEAEEQLNYRNLCCSANKINDTRGETCEIDIHPLNSASSEFREISGSSAAIVSGNVVAQADKDFHVEMEKERSDHPAVEEAESTKAEEICAVKEEIHSESIQKKSINMDMQSEEDNKSEDMNIQGKDTKISMDVSTIDEVTGKLVGTKKSVNIGTSIEDTNDSGNMNTSVEDTNNSAQMNMLGEVTDISVGMRKHSENTNQSVDVNSLDEYTNKSLDTNILVNDNSQSVEDANSSLAENTAPCIMKDEEMHVESVTNDFVNSNEEIHKSATEASVDGDFHVNKELKSPYRHEGQAFLHDSSIVEKFGSGPSADSIDTFDSLYYNGFSNFSCTDVESNSDKYKSMDPSEARESYSNEACSGNNFGDTDQKGLSDDDSESFAVTENQEDFNKVDDNAALNAVDEDIAGNSNNLDENGKSNIDSVHRDGSCSDSYTIDSVDVKNGNNFNSVEQNIDSFSCAEQIQDNFNSSGMNGNNFTSTEENEDNISTQQSGPEEELSQAVLILQGDIDSESSDVKKQIICPSSSDNATYIIEELAVVPSDSMTLNGQSDEVGITLGDANNSDAPCSNDQAVLTINLENTLSNEDHNFQEIIFATDQQLEDIISLLATDNVNVNEGEMIQDSQTKELNSCDLFSDMACQSKVSGYTVGKPEDPLEEAMYSSGILDVNDIPMGNVIEVSSCGDNTDSLDLSGGLLHSSVGNEKLDFSHSGNAQILVQTVPNQSNLLVPGAINVQFVPQPLNVQVAGSNPFPTAPSLSKYVDGQEHCIDLTKSEESSQDESEDTLTSSEMETSQNETEYVSDSEVDNGTTSRITGSDLSVLIVSNSSSSVSKTYTDSLAGSKARRKINKVGNTGSSKASTAAAPCQKRKQTTSSHPATDATPVNFTPTDVAKPNCNIQHVTPFIYSAGVGNPGLSQALKPNIVPSGIQTSNVVNMGFPVPPQQLLLTKLRANFQQQVQQMGNTAFTTFQNQPLGTAIPNQTLRMLPNIPTIFPVCRPLMPHSILQPPATLPVYNYRQHPCSASCGSPSDLTTDHFEQFLRLRHGDVPNQKSKGSSTQSRRCGTGGNVNVGSLDPYQASMRRIEKMAKQSSAGGDVSQYYPETLQPKEDIYIKPLEDFENKTPERSLPALDITREIGEKHVTDMKKFIHEYKQKHFTNVSACSPIEPAKMTDSTRMNLSPAPIGEGMGNVLPPFSTFRQRDIHVDSGEGPSNHVQTIHEINKSNMEDETKCFDSASATHVANCRGTSIPVGHVRPFTTRK